MRDVRNSSAPRSSRDHALEEQLRLPTHRLPQVLVEVRKLDGIGRGAGEVAEIEPLPSEVVDECSRARVPQHPPHLRVEHARVGKAPLRRLIEQLVVGNAAPQEERKARRQLQVAEGPHLAGHVSRGVALDAEQELGTHENPLQRPPDAVLESAVAATRLVELEQHLQVRLGHRPSIGAAGDGRHDPPGAGGLFFRVVRTADEQAAAARRVSRPRRAVRSADGHAAHVRRAGRVGGIDVAAQQRLADRGDLRGRLPEKCHGNRPRSRLDRQAHLQRRVRVHRVRQRGLPRRTPRGLLRRLVGVIVHLERVRPRLRAPDGEQPDSLAVQADLELVRLAQASNRVYDRSQQAHADDVLAVEGKPVTHGDAAPRAERQAVEVIVLGQYRRHEIGRDGRTDRRAADGQAADAPGRPEVALEQQRRHAQRVGDVVESVACIVRRQQGRYVDVESQQIPDDVGVLGAVESMEDGRPRELGSLGPRGVQVGFEPRQERVAHLRVRTRAAGGRHGPRTELAGHPLPGLGGVAHVRQIERVQGQSDRAELSREGRGRPAAALYDALVVARHTVALEELARRSGIVVGRSTLLLRDGCLLSGSAGFRLQTVGGVKVRTGRQEREPAGAQNAQAECPSPPGPTLPIDTARPGCGASPCCETPRDFRRSPTRIKLWKRVPVVYESTP